jgi:large subunit ribosomal protein L14
LVQHRSKLTVADNTGAKSLYVIQSLGGSKKRFGKVGDTLVCVVRGADPGGAVSDHEVVRAVLVRTKKEIRRPDGSYIKFDDNAAVIVDKEGNFRGTRVVGPVAAEVKDKGFTKIASLAEEVV